MKKKFIFLCLIFIGLFLNACASKNENFTSQSVSIFIFSPNIRLNDNGFLKQDKQKIHLEVYKFGRAFFELNISDKICTSGVCYDKTSFNKKFFKNVYYDEFLEDILLLKPLFNGKNLTNTDCGFYQNLISKNYEILYEKCDEGINFRDNISHTSIRLLYI
ncbi:MULTISPECIES: hypothetical protein [unclassified Campylobacter]|uniref:hypothetical protein n=1 Tax=unclassified Campylobacter TaxID=2593542 RepID=UPI0012380175|nr:MULTISPECIES: hypothetical protein [unclassified Campylobacter]KAA6227505.1 hypothetical protein FMM55_02915 [Campylobacter sp. LR196d]KAA6228143.1 hypothetical protein FMM54_01205 [Campylobacter sp. LR185c]KAA6228531.1 hypothetical protein FMM57_02920 [Campylobacter sp. LR286c]KAA6230922.1 hypothetical protein FMM58_04335 [Campylobacter sp. LR291e]KAA8603841.1 hypothetical protein CGP82_05460 [Campylobacter sp. LR185c]